MTIDVENATEIVKEDEYGDCTVSVSAIIATVEDATGLTGGYLDMTGGNCAAVRWELEGAYLLLTDGDIFTYSAGDRQSYLDGWFAGIYSHAEDSSDPIAYGETNGRANADLIGAVTTALSMGNAR